MTTIQSIEAYSPAQKAGIKTGETLVSINGHIIEDVLDYRFYSADDMLTVETHTPGKKIKLYRIANPNYSPLGITFENSLMDRAKSCANKCVFCFIDQLPTGLRETLYFKDDDARLSFLQGNYITLTNLSERELDRIIALRISPIHVSVHTTNPELRIQMMGSKRAGDILPRLQKLCGAGIEVHCQIVVCPGLNDGAELKRTLTEIPDGCASISVVPVGLTKHRAGLPELTPAGEREANDIIDTVERAGRKNAYIADELFLKAKRALPGVEYYDDFPQFENGVGMLALFESEFNREAKRSNKKDYKPFSIATGVAAAPMFQRLLGKYGKIYAIQNDKFGHSVDVAGLVTGGDLIAQLSGEELGLSLYIPNVMLRDGGDVFLDDVSVDDVRRELNIEVVVCENDGAKFAETVFNL
jgi:putative radical SAM enzyme (TIGR03279 family)